MRSFSVIFVLLASLFTTFSASARVDTLCTLILSQEVGFFNESTARLKNESLRTNYDKVVEGAYTRLHYRKDAKGDLVRFAVIGADDYSPALEMELRKLGYFGISIRNPDEATIARFPDFVWLPEWVRTVMPNPKSEQGWLDYIESQSGKDARGKMARKLAKNENIKYYTADLNWADYERWRTELYIPEIMEKKDGAIPVWKPASEQAKLVGDKNFDETKPLENQMVANFKRIFFVDDNGKLLGGSLLQFQPDGLVRIRAAAWTARARDELDLATRGFKVAVDLATVNFKTHMSYGDDMGIAGIDGTVGLIQFKRSLGMRIVPSDLIPDTQLLKVFDEKLAEELRAYTKEGQPKVYAGINLYGIPGDIPDRIERFRIFQTAQNRQLSYEERAELTARALMGLQVGADKNAPPLSVAKGIQTRRLDILPEEPKVEQPKVATAPVNPNVEPTDASGVAIRKICDGAAQVAKPLSQLHVFMQKAAGDAKGVTNAKFVALMMALQQKGITGVAVMALNKGDPNKPEDLLAGIKQELGIQ